MPETSVDDYIKNLIKIEVESRLKNLGDQFLGETWTLDEFRKNCCFNKDREWVKLFIFAQFKDEIVLSKPGGWLKPSKGKGSPYGVYAVEARKWMQANRNRIDWNAKLPRG
ncbi:DUF771 domain-containing protein [Ligilactobacillus apodemi]|uniref:DUF771 domain-containing protein n=1 Tax=Ligilactobacillus apodemi TaxID=307126 RepID=UPI00214B6021|nr:DUF771 domain-containing protein [Ligilactobacillus apodemi]MCR1900902.1 DUF771 domain-containing protein [Ligilactobacillus apodemi]